MVVVVADMADVVVVVLPLANDFKVSDDNNTNDEDNRGI
jgi:hypothetical protein